MRAGSVVTVDRRLGGGPVLRSGTRAPYRSVAVLDGEPHTVRSDLIGAATAPASRPRGRTLACVAHVTDLHMTDVQSPARFEFINREYEDPRFHELLPMQRPQEALNAHAIEAMVGTLDGIDGGPLTGSPLQMVVMSGDVIDNAQSNELAAFMSLLDGGLVHPDSGGSEYEGVQAPNWPDDTFWKPDGGPEVDVFRSAYGFPPMPGLLQRALKPFRAGGLSLPWLGCHGNHERLSQGVGIVTPELAAAMVGDRKPVRLPAGFDRDAALENFVHRPHALMTGPDINVTPDAGRRPIGRHEFVEAHFRPGARPSGHGFSEDNRRDGTAYYVYDTPDIRYITLDTACPAGGAAGCIDEQQVRWLERRLEEVHSSFRLAGGAPVSTSLTDKLVVISSHHGLDTLTNDRGNPGTGASRYVSASELLEVLLRFDNIVLWLNGHIHGNRVQARHDPMGIGNGFWEVTTCSLVDWPCQARLIELFDAGEGLLAIACTMVDHGGSIESAAETGSELAGLHRRLAGNMPMAGFDSWRPGTATDRNVILPVRAPFAFG